MYVGYSNEWPSVVVTFSYSCKPCGFCGKTYCGKEIPDGLFDAREFTNVEDGVLLLFHGGLQVVMDGLCGWHNISCIKRFCATWRAQDEGVCIVIAISDAVGHASVQYKGIDNFGGWLWHQCVFCWSRRSSLHSCRRLLCTPHQQICYH